MNIIDYMVEQGLIGIAAMGAIVASVILFLVWLFLALKHRRSFKLRLAVALLLGAIGCLVYDRVHISLNLAMRDPAQISRDCEVILARRLATVRIKEGLEMHLSRAQLPPSFILIGAKGARVTVKTVQIFLDADSWGGGWGFIYDPQHSNPEIRRPSICRPTWYQDFYEFRIFGE